MRVGGRYKLDSGSIVVDRLYRIEFDDITPSLAGKSGLGGVAEFLEVARHGKGQDVCLVEFHYERDG